MTRQWQLASHASRQRHVTTLMWDTLARTKPRRNDHRAAPYQAGCRHGLRRNGTGAFEPNMQDEVRHASQLNGSFLIRGLITRNEREVVLQFACDLL